jgi:arylsulfatase
MFNGIELVMIRYSSFLTIGATYLCILLALFGFRTNKDDKQKFNILFLMSDQHRGDYINHLGADWLQTPNLDLLAEEGVSFTNAYVSVPSCLPARASILTGMSPWRHGLLGYKPIPNYRYEMPQIFTDFGYRTHAVGKNHFEPMRNKHGYQTVELEEAWYTAFSGKDKCDYTMWFEKNVPGKDINASGLHYTDHRGGISFPFDDKYHPTYWTADRAIDFLKQRNRNEQWFLKVSFQRPHPPFDPPKRWLDSYEGAELPDARVGGWAEKKYGHRIGSLENDKNSTSGKYSKKEIAASRRSYSAAISFVDEQIGRILNELKKTG